MSKTRKIVHLVKYCQTRGQVPELMAALERERPSLWQELFDDTANSSGKTIASKTSGVEVSGYELEIKEIKGRPRLIAKPISPSPLTTARSLDRFVHPQTGIELVRIPAGPFLFGSTDDDELAFPHEKPQRTVELPEFWIGLTAVTNDQFSRFVNTTGYQSTAEEKGQGYAWTGDEWDWVKGADWRHPSGPDSTIAGKGAHPVVQVSWLDAVAFCEWAGLELPSEQQWEKAARGDRDGRIWPWANDPPTADHCNFNNNVGDTTPVGRYSPRGDSPYGCQDMVGNVWEWTGSWYDSDQTRRVLRGGSWYLNQRLARVANRHHDRPPVNRHSSVGFRVAAPVVSVF